MNFRVGQSVESALIAIAAIVFGLYYEEDSLLSRRVEIRYFLSKIVKIRAMSQKNGCKCDSMIWAYYTEHIILAILALNAM